MSGQKDPKKIFIGVAWPYVNGELHIGHLAGYLLPADICARYFRTTGRDVLMVSGSDCYGTPITLEADKKKVSPREIVETYHQKDVHLFKDVLGLTYDLYTKTDTEHHVKVVQDLFVSLLEHGYVFVSTTKQYYSPEGARFLPDRYVEGTCKNCGFTEARSDQCDNCGKVLEQDELENPRSKVSGGAVELKETQHYFIDWQKLQPQIEAFVAQKGPQWKHWIYQETLGWLKQGLKPRAITRDIDWGVPLPAERIPPDLVIEHIEQKRLYVWFDAVTGYLSASMLWAEQNGRDWKEFWYKADAKHYYFMGKDNLVFHTIFWPGQLIGYDPRLHLPDIPSINMFLTLEGKQFSKSRGISIPIEDIVVKYGNDPVRFYLTLIMPEFKDSSFTWTDFIEMNNNILVGVLGNFIHRTLSLLQNSIVPMIAHNEVSDETRKIILNVFEREREYGERCEFKNFLETLLEVARYGNKYVDHEKIWLLKKDNRERFQFAAKQLYALMIAIGYMMIPLFPDTSKKLFDLLGLKMPTLWPSEVGAEIEEIESMIKKIDNSIIPIPLFKKIETASPDHG